MASCKHIVTSVTDSRTNGFGEVRRRRECMACKARWTTRELPESEINELLSLRAGIISDAVVTVTFERRNFQFRFAKET